MRKKLAHLLKCPNSHKSDLKVFALSAERNGVLIYNLNHDQLLDDDDIVHGLIISENSRTAYPISEFIAVLLCDNDIDINYHQSLLKELIGRSPEHYNSILLETIERFSEFKDTPDGKWNRDEMRYYDSEVNTHFQREEMLKNIKNIPHWRIFLPRQNHLINFICENSRNQYILEIGCGNSRTVSWIFNPAKFDYNYIGSDISFKRLMVAKSAIPEGDFIQASALNLPFVDNSFYALISFGMLHHLPRPVDAIRNSATLVKKEGYFIFHEPIIKPEIKFPGMNAFKKAMTDYQHSEHDGKIDLDDTLVAFNDLSYSQQNLVKELSIVRSFVEALLKKVSRRIMKSKRIIRLITLGDRFFLNTVGRVSKRGGANAVYGVMKKMY